MKATIVIIVMVLLSPFGSKAISDTLNRVDDFGQKQGWWIIYGKDIPNSGYPDDGIIEKAYFEDDKIEGTCYRYHQDGKTIRLIGEFLNNRPHGKYQKFYDDGALMEESSFISGKQKGDFNRYYRNGQKEQTKFFNEDGVEEGTSYYYFNNGQVEMSYEVSNGVLEGVCERFFRNGSLKERTIYHLGTIINRQKFDQKLNEKEQENDLTKPLKDSIETRYNSKNNAPLMEGEFKNGELWNGKKYIYDTEGILIKIEIWKDGKYQSDQK